MPRIKRWFPVSHDINGDAEVWAMRKEIGEKSLSIWLELLSIADRNESRLPGDYDQLIRLVSGRCQSTVSKVSAVLEYAKSRLWLESQPCLRIAKWSEYHKTREPKKIPQEKQISSLLPSEPSEPSSKENIKRKVQYPETFEVSDEVREWAREKGMPDPDSQLEAFRDHHTSKASRFIDWQAAFRTWLRNQKRWTSKNGNDSIYQESKSDYSRPLVTADGTICGYKKIGDV